ncbi:hypothetical protein, partial [Streptomyces sp. NPDC055085]
NVAGGLFCARITATGGWVCFKDEAEAGAWLNGAHPPHLVVSRGRCNIPGRRVLEVLRVARIGRPGMSDAHKREV